MDLDDKITAVRDALENAGMHTWEIAPGIINIFTEKVESEKEGESHTNYMCTVTVTP